MPDQQPDDHEHHDDIAIAIAALAGTDRDDLAVDGIAARELADRFGTPCYVFSARVLRERAAAVRTALGERFELLYSIKANPSVAVTRILRECGAGAEIASTGELEVALAAGHDPATLRFAGPGKGDRELERALHVGLGVFHVESLDELTALAGLARTTGRPAQVAIRVNLPQSLRGARMRMGGGSSRFGIDAEQVPDAVRTITDSDALALTGLHVYGGTQCFDADAFLGQARALAEHAASWERELDVTFDELDLGGGFGVAAYEGDPTFDLEAVGDGLRELLAEHDRPTRRWFVELGRYLTAPAGVFLTRVVRSKRSGERQHVACDGGMHQAAAACGVGTVLRRPPLLVAAERLRADRDHQVSIGGPLCTPADQFADGILLPELRTGDLLAILNQGAYGMTFSPTGFLSHPTPAEILVDGDARIVRARGDDRDALRGQQPGT